MFEEVYFNIIVGKIIQISIFRANLKKTNRIFRLVLRYFSSQLKKTLLYDFSSLLKNVFVVFFEPISKTIFVGFFEPIKKTFLSDF